MKITAFNGSPRGRSSITHLMISKFLEGAVAAGALTEHVYLIEKKIAHCRGCFSCWVKTPGNCIINDDMTELLGKFSGSDIVIFASPLYVDNMTGIMKDFMDRLIPLLDPRAEKDDNDECRHFLRYGKNPKIVMISNSGFPEQSHFQALDLLIHRVACNFRTEVIAEIYLGGGSVLKSTSPKMKAIILAYLDSLKVAGKDVVETGHIMKKTQIALEKPLRASDEYLHEMNQAFEKALIRIQN